MYTLIHLRWVRLDCAKYQKKFEIKVLIIEDDNLEYKFYSFAKRLYPGNNGKSTFDQLLPQRFLYK